MTPSTSPRTRRRLGCGLAAVTALALLGSHLGGSPAAPSAAAARLQGAASAAALADQAAATTPAAPVATVATAVRAGAVTTATQVAARAPRAGEEAVLSEQRAAGLECSTSSRGIPVCVHGDDTRPPQPVAQAPISEAGTLEFAEADSPLGCYGDGTSGPRIRAVYARPEGSTDRFAATAASVRSWAGALDAQFDRSAQRTGGRRHLRFATTAGPNCVLAVLNVVLPSKAFASFTDTIDALEARGLHADSSKYLVWADTTGLCGIGTTYSDDQPGLANLNNSERPSYARVDRSCWGKAEAHELVHMLGGVQRSAANSTGGFHCSDGIDVMCYDDRTARSTQRSVCAEDQQLRLDCRNDDYFSTAAPRGSYLQTHWNTARSSFLSPELTDPQQPQPTQPSSSPAPRPSSSPAPPVAPQPGPSASPSPSPSSSTSGSGGLLPSLPVPLPTLSVPLL